MINFFPPAAPTTPIAAVMGNFDGFHLGHRWIVDQLLQTAADKNLPPWLITFAPHPRIFFNNNVGKNNDKEFENFLLTTLDEKNHLAMKYGLVGVASIAFDQGLANLSPADFVKNILIEKLSVASLLVGKDFRYGKGRSGDAESLQQHGIPHLVALDLKNTIDGLAISSSAIRERIYSTDITAANSMLGRAFTLSAKIIDGDKQGRSIGFPTANLDIENLQGDKKILPPHGIYAVTASIEGDDKKYLASCYHGVRAGLDKKMTERVEAYLFDFDSDCYGKTITLSYHRFIRGDKKIDNLPDLKTQIAADNLSVMAVAKELQLLA